MSRKRDNNISKKRNGVVAFWTRQLFSASGFLFIVLFSIRGICQGVLTYVDSAGEIRTAFSEGSGVEGILFLADSLKHPYVPVLDIWLLICGILASIHGVIGGYYAAMTGYKPGGMWKEKIGFYLQILSAIGGGCIIAAVMSPVGEAKTHSLVFWLIIIILAVTVSFHLANGFFNASITLGISVSERTKFVFKILAWVVAVISTLQVLVYFI